MDGWMDGGVVVTLQGGGDGVGQFEVASDPGADPGAVQGASTFMRPERTASLRTHSTDEKHMRTQVCESHLRESEGESRCLTNTTLNSVSCDSPRSCCPSGWRSASSPASSCLSSLTRCPEKVCLIKNTSQEKLYTVKSQLKDPHKNIYNVFAEKEEHVGHVAHPGGAGCSLQSFWYPADT